MVARSRVAEIRAGGPASSSRRATAARSGPATIKPPPAIWTRFDGRKMVGTPGVSAPNTTFHQMLDSIPTAKTPEPTTDPTNPLGQTCSTGRGENHALVPDTP